MKITKGIQIEDLLDALARTTGNVYLKSNQGDCYNLKSVLSRYVALGALINDYAEELELFCEDPTDEQYLYMFFEDHPEVL
jgi:hypothetical protein